MRKGVVLGVVVCAVLFAGSVIADTADELRSKINDQSAKIDALNREIATYQAQLESLGTKKQTLQNTLAVIDITRKQLTAQINLTKSKIADTEQQIRVLQLGITNKENLIAQDRGSLAYTLYELHASESASFAESLLSGRSLSELWNDSDQLENFHDAIQAHIVKLDEIKQSLTDNKTVIEGKRKELLVEQRALAQQEQSLIIATNEQKALLARTKSQESSYQKILTDKRTAKANFEKALEDLETKLKYVLDTSLIPAAGKGVLSWPIDKVGVTQYFGNTAFAKSGAYNGKGHNGIDLRATIGTPIKAALSGTITGTGNSDAVAGCYSYGKWVLIKHPNGLSTLYAHLSQISVSEGTQIYTGDVIGYSGATGYATGPHLHFGVYASDGVKVVRLKDATRKSTACGNAVIPIAPVGAYLNPIDYLPAK